MRSNVIQRRIDKANYVYPSFFALYKEQHYIILSFYQLINKMPSRRSLDNRPAAWQLIQSRSPAYLGKTTGNRIFRGEDHFLTNPKTHAYLSLIFSFPISSGNSFFFGTIHFFSFGFFVITATWYMINLFVF